MKRLILPLIALGSIAAAPPPDPEDARAPVPAGFYRLASAVKLPGKSPDWDYLAYDAARGRLFIARRDAGLWAFDTKAQRLVKQIADTRGAGASVLIPALGRGFSVNEDGSLTVFDLATLATIKRVKIGEDADSASYDAASGRIAMVSADSRTIHFVDARTLAPVGSVALTAKKADGSAPDGEGHLLVNERDRDMVARIDIARPAVSAEWPLAGCSQPTAMAYDAKDHRAFIGCRGAKPVLTVLNGDSGAVVAQMPIGRGVDGLVYDPARRTIVASAGVDANLVVFHQDDADHYRMEQAVTTRPYARTIAYDPKSRRIFSVTAEGVVNPAEPVNTGPSPFYPNAYYDGSFTVLTYAPGGVGGRSGG